MVWTGTAAGGEDFKGDSTRIAARAQLRSAAESCPEAAGLAAARFLLRVHPRVRPHELDGHIRKEDSQRLAVRRPATVH
jgi:hypothetical protein